MNPLPDTVEQLILELDQLYPEQCPYPDMEDRKIWMRAGQRELVRALMARLERAKRNII